MKTFPEKIDEIERELQELEDEPVTPGLLARQASLRRSLRWYRARAPRVITPLGVSVGDSIHAGESTG